LPPGWDGEEKDASVLKGASGDDQGERGNFAIPSPSAYGKEVFEKEEQMKRGVGFWLLWALALVGMSSCAMSERKRNATLAGAAIGAAVGAGVGAAVGPNFGDGDEDEQWQGAGIGAAGGALIGGVIGYLVAGEEPPPPPPPPPAPPARPAPPPPPPPAPPAPAESKKIILRGITFDFNKATIKPEFAPVLDEAEQILKNNPRIRVTIEGHTDSIGSEAYNQRLSERRADAVKRYLVSRGVEADRLETIGYGKSRPIAPNKTPNGRDNPEGRAMNRRAELKVQ
jgi:OOP family OmpA-OmpF porin